MSKPWHSCCCAKNRHFTSYLCYYSGYLLTSNADILHHISDIIQDIYSLQTETFHIKKIISVITQDIYLLQTETFHIISLLLLGYLLTSNWNISRQISDASLDIYLFQTQKRCSPSKWKSTKQEQVTIKLVNPCSFSTWNPS